MRVFLVTWNDAAWHTILIFTAQVLTETGHSVDIIYRRPNSERKVPGPVDYGTGTRLHPVGRGQIGWRNQLAYLDFCLRVAILARRLRPDVLVGYDMHGVTAAYLGNRVLPGARLIYHNFDITTTESLGRFARMIKHLEGIAARSAGLNIASSPGRAQILQEEARLARTPIVFYNCQRRSEPQATTGELGALLCHRGLNFERIVVRLGSLGPNHGIEATVRSVPRWRGNWGLILAGMGDKSYLTSIGSLIRELGMCERIVLLPAVSYSLWYDCLSAADLGIALYRPGNINHVSMAGAATKLNLYLKAGVPSIVPDIPDFVAFIEKYGIGRATCPDDPIAIADAINSVFENSDDYARMCGNARTAFRIEFNFERQIEPILRWLESQ